MVDDESTSGWGEDKTSKATLETNSIDEMRKLHLTSLSQMTGFPVDFIKTELLLEEDELSVAELRQRMANYLDEVRDILFEA